MKWLMVAAAFFGLSGVVLGALGAHGLNERLIEAGRLEAWTTAVNYQMWHALALLVIGIWFTRVGVGKRGMDITGGLFIAGVILFCGSIYLLALGGPSWLGPVTPLGGLCLVGGWLSLLVKAWRLG